MGVSVYELASDAQHVEAEGRHLVLEYRLVRERLGDGVETHVVRCCQREMKDGQVVRATAEVAGLGDDPHAARWIYGLLVRAAALPVHLQDVVREARQEYGAARPAAWRAPNPRGERPQ